jgi:hypothetical protein
VADHDAGPCTVPRHSYAAPWIRASITTSPLRPGPPSGPAPPADQDRCRSQRTARGCAAYQPRTRATDTTSGESVTTEQAAARKIAHLSAQERAARGGRRAMRLRGAAMAVGSRPRTARTRSPSWRSRQPVGSPSWCRSATAG